MKRQFARFLFAGGVAAASNFLSRIGFSMIMPLEPAVVAAYLIGMAVAFVLMRSAVFPSSPSSLRRQIGLFALVNVLAVAQTLVITVLLARWALPAMQVRDFVNEIAHFVGVCVPIVTSFYGHKYLSFGQGRA